MAEETAAESARDDDDDRFEGDPDAFAAACDAVSERINAYGYFLACAIGEGAGEPWRRGEAHEAVEAAVRSVADAVRAIAEADRDNIARGASLWT